MTEASAPAASPWRADNIDRTLALINYGLLFASIFFAGIPGLIAVIIAYAQRAEAPARIKSHLSFQIRVFWTAFGLSIVASASALGAFMLAAMDMLEEGPDQTWSGVSLDMAHMLAAGDFGQVHPTPIVALAVVALLTSVVTMLWLIAAPAVGFIRLATDRAIGEGGR
jgi:uncharacterized membrane protein